MSEMKHVKSNTIYNLLTVAITKVVTLVLIILLARYLGAEGYGKMSFAIGFTALFAIVGDFGVAFLIKRYISKEQYNVNKYVNTSFILKIIFNAAGVVLILLTALLLQYTPEQFRLILIASGIVFFANLGPFRSAFEGFERMGLAFYTRTTKVIVRLGLILFLIFTGGSVESMLFAYLVSEIVLLIVEIIVYNNTIGKLQLVFDKQLAKRLVRESIPFGLAALFMTVYDKIDITMLSKLTTNTDIIIGWYSSSYELMSAIAFLPGILTGALAPIAFRNAHNKGKLKKIFDRTYSLFSLFALPIMIGGTILAKEIITLIYGTDFLSAAVALQILIWAIFFQFQMFSMGLVLNALHLERITMRATLISLIVNIVLNSFLIPMYSYIGASIATVLSVATYFFYCKVYVKKSIKAVFLTPLLKPIGASIIMSGVLLLLRTRIPVLITILIAAGIYFLCLHFIGGIKKDDFSFLQGK